jgi:hypothetical protein
MDTRRDNFVDWLAAVTAAPAVVAVSAVPWSSFAESVPVCLLVLFPRTWKIQSYSGPSKTPSFYTLGAYAWRHIVDKYLSSSIAIAVSFFTTYLDLMAPAIPAQSYVGFPAPPSLFPSATFQFPIHGGWPLNPDWMSALKLTHFASPQANLWEPSVIDLITPGYVVPVLQTVADSEAAEHRHRTPPLPASLLKSQPPALASKVPASTEPLVTSQVPAPTAAPTLAPAPALAPTLHPATAPTAGEAELQLQQQIVAIIAHSSQQLEVMKAKLPATNRSAFSLSHVR